MQRSKGLMLLAVLCTASLMSGCATATLETDASCRIFKPIRASAKDTTDTKRQVVEHNAAFTGICDGVQAAKS